jgi:hypothetical protein
MVQQFGRRRVLPVAVIVLVLAAASAGSARSGGPPDQSSGPVVGSAVAASRFAGDVRRIPRSHVEPDDHAAKQIDENPPSAAGDQAVQTATPTASAPSPTTNFAGLDQANWGAGWPPDTNGDVGPNYYIQAVNTSIGLFDKSTGSRVAAFTFDALFSQAPTGTPCDNDNQGDPVALYDPIGDRYIVSDFAWSNYTSGAMYQCIAVSRTNDPVSGGWYFYAFQTESGGLLPDYPKLAVWPDGVYMSANIFSTTGSGSYQHAQVWVFDRTAMEAGTSARSVSFNLPSKVGGTTVFSLLPSNTRVVTGLPPTGSPNYFASIYGSYAVRVWKFHVDWSNTSNSTFTGPTNVPIATFNVGPSNVPEKGGNNVDTLSYRLMFQNQYTNENGRESLWLTHTVGNGGSPNVAQVRWYQLSVTGGTIASSPVQQSTWAPDAKNRFMPSLAVDKNGDMAIGYSVSDSTMYPSIRYAARLAGDPANTLSQAETSLIEGTGYQCCSFSNGQTNTRWGDYSAMTIDPDGCTFWYTNEYYDVQPTSLAQDDWKTRIGSFTLPGCNTAPQAAPTVTSFSPTSGPPGTGVTITGTGLTGASSVTFNGTAASFTVNSATQITATVPANATSGVIAVTTSAGAGASANAFTVTAQPAPAISGFSPTSGTVGTTVTISGSGFTGATGVAFNGVAASSFTVNSDSQITATVPAAAASGPISVSGPGGTVTSSSSFTVTASAIVNGNFETGTFAGWTTGGGQPAPVISTTRAHSPTHSALLGWTGSVGEPTGDSWIQQQFSVPAGGGTLSFYVWEFTTDSVTYDWQTCQIRNTSGATLATLFKEAANGETWVQRSYSLANWAGQNVVLWCNVHEDGWGDQTYMYLDDVAVN